MSVMTSDVLLLTVDWMQINLILYQFLTIIFTLCRTKETNVFLFFYLFNIGKLTIKITLNFEHWPLTFAYNLFLIISARHLWGGHAFGCACVQQSVRPRLISTKPSFINFSDCFASISWHRLQPQRAAAFSLIIHYFLFIFLNKMHCYA